MATSNFYCKRIINLQFLISNQYPIYNSQMFENSVIKNSLKIARLAIGEAEAEELKIEN